MGGGAVGDRVAGHAADVGINLPVPVPYIQVMSADAPDCNVDASFRSRSALREASRRFPRSKVRRAAAH